MQYTERPLGSISLRVLTAALVVSLGCQSKKPQGPPTFLEDPLVTSAGVPKPAPVGIDICLDSTPSMEGFAADPNSVYLTLLDELEGAVQNKMRDSEVRYFKFGDQIRQVSRMDFRKAKDKAFYHEPGFSERTNIELVFARDNNPGQTAPTPDPSGKTGEPQARGLERVAIVVTDMLESDSDVNWLVSNVRKSCFQHGYSLGILPVLSEFEGMVYDVKVPPYPYKSTPGSPSTFRPFYLLFVGAQDRLEDLINLLSSRPYVAKDKFLLISPKITRHYSVTLRKDKTAKDLNLRGTGTAPDEYEFSLRKGATGGRILAEVQYEAIPACALLDPIKVGLTVITGRKGQSGRPTSDIRLLSTGAAGGKIAASMDLVLPPEPGEYNYQLLFYAGSVGSMTPPAWVKSLSSENPTPKLDAEKTLNLYRVVQGLIDANQVVNQPPVARAYLKVKRLG